VPGRSISTQIIQTIKIIKKDLAVMQDIEIMFKLKKRIRIIRIIIIILLKNLKYKKKVMINNITKRETLIKK